MAAETLTLATRGSFSLAASTRFLEGFAPAGTVHSEAGQRLGLAFPVEGDRRRSSATSTSAR